MLKIWGGKKPKNKQTKIDKKQKRTLGCKMLIFKEKLAKSAEHVVLAFFPLIFLTCLLFFSNAIKKSQQKTKSRTQICIFPDLFPMFSRFPKLFLQNQHFAAKFPFFYLFILLFCFFWVFCWVSVFQVFLFWLFFVFYFQSFFELFFCFFCFIVFFSESAIPWAFKFTTIYCILFLYVGKMKLWN